jgi:hypothetical protein
MPIFIELVAILLENVQKIKPPQKSMPRKNHNKSGNEKIKKYEVPIQGK